MVYVDHMYFVLADPESCDILCDYGKLLCIHRIGEIATLIKDDPQKYEP